MKNLFGFSFLCFSDKFLSACLKRRVGLRPVGGGTKRSGKAKPRREVGKLLARRKHSFPFPLFFPNLSLWEIGRGSLLTVIPFSSDLFVLLAALRNKL